MRRADFEFVRTLVRDEAAIVLDESKEYLVESRLRPLARRHGFKGLEDLLFAVRSGHRRELSLEIVDAMTTNETSFFRDDLPWQALREDVLPELVERRKARRRLRVWSAACSTGQEPFTLAMMIHDHFPSLLDWDLEIRATDISPTVLERAREGRFQRVELDRGVPAHLRSRWFRSDGEGGFRIDRRAVELVTFQRLNLAGPWPALPTFDLIFVRNVLIYFDTGTKREILARMERHLASDGYLLLGSGETTLNLGLGLRRRQHRRSWFYQHG